MKKVNDDDVVGQPTLEQQMAATRMIYDEPDTVELRGRKIKMRWINGHATEKVTRVMLAGERRSADGYPLSEGMVVCKCAAALRLNGYWKIRMLWWAVWRWYYYVRQYSEFELLPLIAMAQKKTPVLPYYQAITSLTVLKETRMNMTRQEVEREQKRMKAPSATRQERSGDSDGK